jgi:hypothetical protein
MAGGNSIFGRNLVKNMGTGRVAVPFTEPAGPAEGQGSTSTPILDLKTKYPKPASPDQSEPWPGLASKVNPRADHRETSCKAGAGRAPSRNRPHLC